jgi:hypothetical protein
MEEGIKVAKRDAEGNQKYDDVVLIDKPVGWTPLKTIIEYKKRNPELKDAKVCGRIFKNYRWGMQVGWIHLREDYCWC